MKTDSRKRRDEAPARPRQASLTARIFGELELHRANGQAVAVGGNRLTSLLGYLLAYRSPQPRKRLASQLWPESTDAQARTNLRHALHELRRAMPDIDRFLNLDATALSWKTNALTVDAQDFETCLAQARSLDGTEKVQSLREAVERHRGALLEGIDADWVIPERDRLRALFAEALEQLARRLGEAGASGEAIAYAERLLQHDPLREETYLLLMRLHESQGSRARALRVYHTCAATLAREVGVRPSPAIRRVYESLLANDAASDSDGLAESNNTSLVGRTQELTKLQHLWLATEGGHAQLVIVSGEAGVGKTRLVDELRSWCVRRGGRAAEARAYAAEGALAYSAIVAWLRADGFRDRLARAAKQHPELGRLLPEFSNASTRHPPDASAEAEERQRLFEAITSVLLRSPSPTLLIADDLQWFDRDSLQFIHYVNRIDPFARLLIVATLRKEDVNPSQEVATVIAAAKGLGRSVEIELGRLSEEGTAALAASLNRGIVLTPAGIHTLHRETEGNPLFIVEAIRAGWQPGEARWTTPKVQGVIESRLAHVSEAGREVLTTAAAIGREFTSEVLTRASDVGGQALVSALDELWRRGLIRDRGSQGYDFSHDKIREVTYFAASPVRRRHDHVRIARALEELHALDARAVSGIIAAHYESAGAVDSAVTWYERAAAVALQMGTNAEALRILERALDALTLLPHDADRDRRELALRATVVGLLGSFHGLGSSKLADEHQRAMAFAEARGLEVLPPLLRSFAMISLTRGDFSAADDAGEQLLARARRDDDRVLQVEAKYILGIAAFWRGNLAAARRHFEEAVADYLPEHRAKHLVHYGQDPKVICLSRLANTLFFLGEFDQAWQAADTALALADEIGHLHTRATALTFATLLGIEARDDRRVRACAAGLRDAAHQYESIQSRIGANAIAGYVDVLDGRPAAGITRVVNAIGELGGAVHAPGIHMVLARILIEACVRANELASGLEAADRALASAGEVQVFEAEIRRLRAECLAGLGPASTDVASELTRAREAAQRQGALAFELRIAVTALRYHQGRQDSARTLVARQQLTDVLTSRPRWDDSADLRDATALLRQ